MINTVPLVGRSHETTSNLIGGLAKSVQGGAQVVGNQYALNLFEKALNEGAETLVKIAEKSGIENPEQFRVFGNDKKTLALGYQALRKKIEEKNTNKEKAGIIQSALAPQETKVVPFKGDAGPISLQEAEKQTIQSRKPSTYESALQKKDVQEGVAKYGAGLISGLFPSSSTSKGGLFSNEGFVDSLEKSKLAQVRKTNQKLRKDVIDIIYPKGTTNLVGSLQESVGQIKRTASTMQGIQKKFEENNIPFNANTLGDGLSKLGKYANFLTEKERQKIVASYANIQRSLADYIKNISGAQASDKEVVRLKGAVALGLFSSYDDYLRAFNSLIRSAKNGYKLSEEKARRLNPELYDKIVSEGGSLPRQKLNTLSTEINSIIGTNPEDVLTNEMNNRIDSAMSDLYKKGSKAYQAYLNAYGNPPPTPNGSKPSEVDLDSKLRYLIHSKNFNEAKKLIENNPHYDFSQKTFDLANKTLYGE